jgi:ActR/RegA family two-component response regulator
VDLIISDQRMPGMTGVEFLRKAKISYPDTVRIVLSGYTELQSVTDAINEGAVYRFLTKPWEDEVLREQIQNALEYRELLDKNRQLDIKIHSANQELVATNRQLGNLLQQKREQIERGANSLSIAREALEWVPMPVLGIDDLGTIVFANSAAQKTLAGQGLLTGAMLAHALADIHAVVAATTHDGDCTLQIDRVWYRVQWRSIGSNPLARGKLITLLAADAPASAHPLSNRRTGTGASSA